MRLGETKATALWIETPNDVRMMALILQDYYEEDMPEDPDNEVFITEELSVFIDDYLSEDVKSAIDESYPAEFAKLEEFLSSLDESEPVVIKLTEEMKIKVDDILPQMYSDDGSENNNGTDEDDE